MFTVYPPRDPLRAVAAQVDDDEPKAVKRAVEKAIVAPIVGVVGQSVQQGDSWPAALDDVANGDAI